MILGNSKLLLTEEADIDLLSSDFEQEYQELEIECDFNDSLMAYKVYEPLLKSQASKAVTAQYFAALLNTNKEIAKDILYSHSNLQYLIKAILHVTGGGIYEGNQ